MHFSSKERNYLTSQSHNKSYSHWVDMMCWKWPPFTQTRAQSLLRHWSIAVSMVKTGPELNQPLFQFNTVDACLINTFPQGRPYPIVSWVVIWAVQKPEIQWCLYATVWWCHKWDVHLVHCTAAYHSKHVNVSSNWRHLAKIEYGKIRTEWIPVTYLGHIFPVTRKWMKHWVFTKLHLLLLYTIVWQHGWGERFYSRYVRWSFLTATGKKLLESLNRKQRSQKQKQFSFFSVQGEYVLLCDWTQWQVINRTEMVHK